MTQTIFILFAASLVAVVTCGHFYNADGTPYDAYHNLHLIHDPPLYPTYREVPNTGFTCSGLGDQLWADTAAQCQAYHLCQGEQLVSSHLCVNGTLFNQQFQVCDQFYNVRCGSPYEDL
ncbi:U-scoloptoxin(01)-Er1a-like [Neodiprion pinetum]|uniref:U-scoloptoxin(01)-Er1a n=1 Tax=Neodiprion lecontei TaxID=441921 RepID=A0A6J0BNB1_NEOLC|nr:U-scoloptoxin(01)-Er1a [Neodiprion lecontei]XP_046420695.1 U-scoloptoxin(01)-Er1a-like [Neodiprion fabricii]XP_046477053.1 U-scoloptoxin(01)-Er1a-like [Neodiprion pinetum]XP_046614520.1 U-scoloptoxin(01)-Er1a-like [Neodiprion virginianus]